MSDTNIPADSPFHPDNQDAYLRWRDAKLADYPTDAAALIVEVKDPRALSAAEYDALLARLRKTNMVIYAGATGDEADKDIPRKLGARFGLTHLDSNYLADDDGITSLTVNPEGEHPQYIPYTNKAIKWHTDGYYNDADHQIRGLILHCVHSAGSGGDNGLIDPEIVYILLRDAHPDFIRVLMRPDVMTIPPGKDGEGGERGAASGPVFSYHAASDSLHMRYTARKRNIEWSKDSMTTDTITYLEQLLDAQMAYRVRARLEPGMGLMCNNVVHDRSAFDDPPQVNSRLIYRARYFDRVAGTALHDIYPSP